MCIRTIITVLFQARYYRLREFQPLVFPQFLLPERLGIETTFDRELFDHVILIRALQSGLCMPIKCSSPQHPVYVKQLRHERRDAPTVQDGMMENPAQVQAAATQQRDVHPPKRRCPDIKRTFAILLQPILHEIVLIVPGQSR
ncbi:hypothetical protein D3C73_1277000 [compost metagenome]